MSRYDVNSILESSTLPIGGAAKRLKDVEQTHQLTLDGGGGQRTLTNEHESLVTSNFNPYASSSSSSAHHLQNWQTLAFQQPHQQNSNSNFSMHGHFPYSQRLWCKQEQDAELHNQLQLGGTHNFFQPSVLHNLMNMDHQSSLEHSSGSNSVIYGNNSGDVNVIPMGTVIANDHGSFGENDNNLYYISHQQSSAGSQCNNWVPTAVPTLAPRTSTMALCHGAPTFTVWNDT